MFRSQRIIGISPISRGHRASRRFVLTQRQYGLQTAKRAMHGRYIHEHKTADSLLVRGNENIPIFEFSCPFLDCELNPVWISLPD